MARSLDAMIADGVRKLTNKASTMKASYDLAKTRMKGNYASQPFGPQTKAKYNGGVDNAVYHAPDPTKWGTNWRAGVSQ